MSNEIEKAKTGRAKCRVCGDAIAEGELRLVDEGPSESAHFSGMINRYYHLDCAARDRPRSLARALKTTVLEIANREALEAQVEGAIEMFEARSEASHAVVGTTDEYREFAASVALADREALAEAALVFADWLQSVGDPRGDLIAYHHAIDSSPAEQRGDLEARAETLLARNAKALVPELADTRFSWRSGFVEAISIRSTSGLVRERLERLWRHPSMLAVRTVEVSCKPWNSAAVLVNLLPLPSSVRTLVIDIDELPLGPIDGLKDTSLTRLSLTAACDISRLAMATLEALELHRPITASEPALTDQLRVLKRKRLPCLASLAIHTGQSADKVVGALLESDLVAGLSSLTLSGGLTQKGALALVSSAAKLEVLDIADNPSMPSEVLKRLGEIAAEVVHTRAGIANEAATETELGEVWKVRHVRKPEWGVGVVIEESDDCIEIEFENAGRKVIRALELIEDA